MQKPVADIVKVVAQTGRGFGVIGLAGEDRVDAQEHHAELVIEVVGDSASQLAQEIQLLGLDEPRHELVAFRGIAEHCRKHEGQSARAGFSMSL